VNTQTHLPVLTTERLLLRVPTERDAEVMARFAADNRDHFAPWDPLRDDDYFTAAYWKRLLAEGIKRLREGTHLQFVIGEQGSANSSVVGQITLSGITRGVFQAAYLGYGLDHRHVGKGYMGEALRATIDYCFGEMNLHRIMANYMPANARSQRLLEKLGFEREGFAPDYLFLAGKWQDHVLMSITNPDWKTK
jgi:ribosomal-protein-alanine N-acetyltransferase